MVKDMQVVVTGASGFVAKNVRKYLSDNNVKLISISRKNFKKFKNEKKIIYTSGLGVSKNTTLGYFISKYKAERQIIDSKLDYTIFRPSYIVGKGDLFTKYLKKQIKAGQIQIPGSGNYSIQPIYIDDVSKIIFNAI